MPSMSAWLKVDRCVLCCFRPTMIKYGIHNIRELFGPKINLHKVYTNPLCRLEKWNDRSFRNIFISCRVAGQPVQLYTCSHRGCYVSELYCLSADWNWWLHCDWWLYLHSTFWTALLHCALSLAAQCIVIGPVYGFVGVCVCRSVTTITRNCIHRSSPNWVCR